MSKESELIKHSGTITKIDEETIYVNIKSNSACSSCHAKGACSSLDSKEKIIEAELPTNSNYKIGDEVNVSITRDMGIQALILGYVLPFLTVIISLIILSIFEIEDGPKGIISLSLLAPYYIFLYMIKDKLKKKFKCQIISK